MELELPDSLVEFFDLFLKLVLTLFHEGFELFDLLVESRDDFLVEFAPALYFSRLEPDGLIILFLLAIQLLMFRETLGEFLKLFVLVLKVFLEKSFSCCEFCL